MDIRLHGKLLLLTALSATTVLSAPSGAFAQVAVAFQDVTAATGVNDGLQQALSVSWVDFNKDGRPDLWLSRHTYYDDYAFPSLFINTVSGPFPNIATSVWPWTKDTLPSCGGVRCVDAHGNSWIDFDNDGDQDLLIPVGDKVSTASFASLFLVNENGKLVDRAAETGLDDPPQRGRSSLWYDWNGDGRLDAYVLAPPRTDGLVAASELFENEGGTFRPVGALAGMHDADLHLQFAQYADVTGDGRPDVIAYADSYRYSPARVYDTSTVPYTDVTSRFPQVSNVRDAAIVDLDNDLHPDIFLARNSPGAGSNSLAYTQSPTRAGFFLMANSGEVGFDLETAGDLAFDVRDYGGSLGTGTVYIGATGRHPATFPFSLAATDATAAGIFPHTAGGGQGLYVGYDSDARTWRVRASSPAGGSFGVWVRAETSADVTRTTTVGSNFAEPAGFSPVLLMWDSATGGYVDRTVQAGLSEAIKGNSVGAADFNNDGFVDLFIDCGDPIKKTPNVLYLNRGDGTFVRQDGAGFSAGPTVGPQNTTNEIELGSKVALADYDGDGFVDVLTTNTNWRGVKYNYYTSASNRLYRNLGNGNHWIEFDLQGTRSNRNGIGARVFVTAGGRTQLREQQGGMHAFAQDNQRIHFGLGTAARTDRIRVDWPSGVSQTFVTIPGDRIYTIREP